MRRRHARSLGTAAGRPRHSPAGGATKSFSGIGPFGFGFRAEDRFPRGYYRLDGGDVITIAEDGTRALPVHTGTAENLCDTRN